MSNPPCELVAAQKQLRVLRAQLQDFDADAIAGLEELRHLDLSHTDGVEALGFVARLKRLRLLHVNGTEVTDLVPLAGHTALADLEFRSTFVTSLAPHTANLALRRIDATFTELATLPGGAS